MPSDWESPEEINKREEMMRTAEPASLDLEDTLADLEALQALRRKNPLIEARYEHLRKIATVMLIEGGPRYFVDDSGTKHYAYAITPDAIVVSVEDVEQLRNEGIITEEELDRVAPRKVKNEEFKRLVALGRIPKARAKKIARIVPKTPYVGFSDESTPGFDE